MGSEMCIRDSGTLDLAGFDLEVRHRVGAGAVGEHEVAVQLVGVGCLLYTSDAADERSSVDLGGRRIIKKQRHH